MENDETKTNPAEMNEKDLPDVRAFEDEFTRSFLQSTEETNPGYYPFESGTGAYKMDFPAGGVIGEKGYGKESKKFEGYLIGIINDSSTESAIKINYFSYDKKGHEDTTLNILEKSIEQNLDFEKIPLDNRTLYIAPFELSKKTFGYAAFIQNELEKGGIQAVYTTECEVSDEKCTKKKDEEKEEIVKWMKSIKFIKNDKESE